MRIFCCFVAIFRQKGHNFSGTPCSVPTKFSNDRLPIIDVVEAIILAARLFDFIVHQLLQDHISSILGINTLNRVPKYLHIYCELLEGDILYSRQVT